MKNKNNTRATIGFGGVTAVLSFIGGANVGILFPAFPWAYALIGTICFLLGGIVFWMLKASNCTAVPSSVEEKKPQPKAPVQRDQAKNHPKVYDQGKERTIYDQDAK